MTDMGITPGDQTINLDLGGVDAIHGWVPIPTGVYLLQVDDASVEATKKGGKQIVFRMKVADGPLQGRSTGIENVFIPNPLSQTPEAYRTTAGYFKGKIEALTGRQFGGALNVKELVGLKFKAIVTLVDEGYGPQNKITAWLPADANTDGMVIPQATPKPRQAESNGGGQTQEAARFRI